MSDFDHFEFYKELYFRENERRPEVMDSLNIPLAIVTALVAGIYILITTFPFDVDITLIDVDNHKVISNIFILLISIAFVFLAISVLYQCKAFANITTLSSFNYQGIPYGQVLFDYHKNLDNYYQLNFPTDPDVDKMADREFKSYLTKEFINAADQNTFVNDKKLTDISISKRFLIGSLIFSVFSLIPYGYVYFKKKDDIQKVEIQNKVHKIEIENKAYKVEIQNPSLKMDIIRKSYKK